jgi:hypothetical protein
LTALPFDAGEVDLGWLWASLDAAPGPSSSVTAIVPAAEGGDTSEGVQDSPDANDAELAASVIGLDNEDGHRGQKLLVTLNLVERALSQFMERQPNEGVRQHLQALQYNIQAFKRMTAGEQISTSQDWRTCSEHPFASDSDDDDMQSDEQSCASTPVHMQRAGPARVQFALPIRAGIPILLVAGKKESPNSPPTIETLRPSDVSPRKQTRASRSHW